MFKFLKRKNDDEKILKAIHELMESNRQVMGYISRLVEKKQEPITVSVRDLPVPQIEMPKVELPEIVIPEPKVIVDSNVPKELAGSIDKLVASLHGFAIRNKEQMVNFLQQISQRDEKCQNENRTQIEKLLEFSKHFNHHMSDMNKLMFELQSAIVHFDKSMQSVSSSKNNGPIVYSGKQFKADKEMVDIVIKLLSKGDGIYDFVFEPFNNYQSTIFFAGSVRIDELTGQIIAPFCPTMTSKEQDKILTLLEPLIIAHRQKCIEKLSNKL